jgi:hypothetical protein
MYNHLARVSLVIVMTAGAVYHFAIVVALARPF